MIDIFKTSAQEEQGSIKLLLKIAIPLIITTSSSSLMSFVDRMFLSWYSADTLAACLPGGLLSFSVISFFMGMCGYTNVFVANYYGKKKFANLSVALWQGVILGFISWIIIAAFVPVGNFLIDSSHHEAGIKVLEKQYYTILALTGGLVVINNALAGFFTGQGKTAVTMFVNVFGNLVNVALSYAMIFGNWGFSEMGIRGAAWSTVIGNAVITIVFFAIIFSPKINKRFRIGRLFGFNKQAAWRLVKYGLPNGFGFFMDIVSFSVFAFFTGNIDKISLAASNIVLTLEMIVFMPLLGLAIATQVLMGRYVGMKRPDLGIRTTWNAVRTGGVYVVGIVLCFIFAPKFFTGLFVGSSLTHDMSLVLEKTVPLMWLLCFFTVGDLMYLCFGDAIRGAGDTKFHMKAMVSCAVFLLMPGTYIIINVLHLGITAAWMWIVFYAWATGVIMMLRFLSGKWKHIDITA